MSSNVLSDSYTRRVLLFYSGLAAVEGLLALVYLLLVPSDQKGAILFGFSPARLLVLGVIVAGILVFGFLAYQFGNNPVWRNWVSEDVLRPKRYFFNIIYVIEWFLFALIIILWIFQANPPEEFQSYYARLLSLIVWFILLAIQSLAVFSWLHYQCGLWGSIKALLKDQLAFELPVENEPLARQRPSIWAIILILLMLLALVVPSTNYLLFSGFPLNSLKQLTALIILLPLVFNHRYLGNFENWVKRKNRFIIPILSGMFAFIIAVKLILLLSGTYQGFTGCYNSPVAKPARGKCALSYENPFLYYAATRIDPIIDFNAENWNFSFFNSESFNLGPWVKEGDYQRDWIPFSARWQGMVDFKPSQKIEVRYSGEGTLQIGAQIFELPAAYVTENSEIFSVPAGAMPLILQYSFDNGFRKGTPGHPGLQPSIQVNLLDQKGDVKISLPLQAVPPGTLWLGLARLVDFFLLAVGLLLLWFYVALLGKSLGIVIGFGVLGAAFYQVLPELSFMALNVLAFSWFVFRPGKHRLLLSYFVFICLAFWRVYYILPGIDSVLIRLAGTDPLIYESEGRAILSTFSLKGGENIFYYQPLYRYFVFLYHMVFGDGDTIRAILMLGMQNFVLFLLYNRLFLRKSTPSSRQSVLPVLIGVTLVAFMNTNVVSAIEDGLTEGLSWILLPLVFYLLATPISKRSWLLATVLFGLAIITRTNHLPGLLFLYLIFLVPVWRKHPGLAIGSCVILGGLMCLPALHNYYYGGKLVLLTASADIPGNLVLPPRKLLFIFSDPRVMSQAWQQWKYVIGIVKASYLDFSICMWVLLGLWLSVWVKIIVNWKAYPLAAKLIMLLPFLFIGVQYFYALKAGYPRHLIAGYMIMGLASLQALSFYNPTAKSVETVE